MRVTGCGICGSDLHSVAMMGPAGTVLGHATIYDRVWGYDFGPSSNSLEVYVGYLRRKLAASGGPARIETLRSVGYRLTDK